jgi:hypothetical protein
MGNVLLEDLQREIDAGGVIADVGYPDLRLDYKVATHPFI